MKSLKINTILNMIKTSTSIVFSLITFPYISRVLMPENVGKVNFGNSFVSYFSLIASLGISTYAIRECSKVRDDKKNLEKIASQIYSINICTTVVAYILLAITLILFRNIDAYRNLIIIQSTVIIFTTLGADWLNTAMEDFAYITIRSVVFQFLSLVLMFLFVKTPEDYVKYALISIVSSSGANVANILYRKRYCHTYLTMDIPWKKHIAPIFFLFVMLFSQTIFNSVDVTMVGLFKGNFEVGIYSTAGKLERLISQIVSSIVFVLIPRFSYMFDLDDYDNINQLLRKVLQVFLTIGLPCFAGVTVMANEIILIIAGKGYTEAALVLQILMISFLFSLVGGSFLGNVVLLPSGKEKQFMIICCVSTLVNVVINAILIPFFGVYAAAGATAFSSLLILVMLVLTVDKRIKINRKLNLFAAPLLGSICIILFCLFIKGLLDGLYIRTIICVAGSVIIYGLVQIFMKNELVYAILGKTITRLRRD